MNWSILVKPMSMSGGDPQGAELEDGDTVYWELGDVEARLSRLRRSQALAAKFCSKKSVVDELIAERKKRPVEIESGCA